MEKEIKNKGQGTIFENSFLELLTKAPHYISASIYLVAIIFLLIVAYRL